METEKLVNYLTNWINKGVMNGGFNAMEARDAMNALEQLTRKASIADAKTENKKGEK